jgi:CDP-diacylglycerol---glycerol-3-phosphate 3-phosphatidyltransferase
MLTVLKPKLEAFLDQKLGIFKGIHPNWLTAAAIIPGLIFFWAVQVEQHVVAVLAFFGLVLDALDGAVARKFHKVSIFGGVLDSTFDRLIDAVLVWAFVQKEVISQELGVVVIVLGFLISYIRSRAGLAFGNDKLFAVGIAERTERIVLIGLTFLLYLFFPQFSIGTYTAAELVFALLALLSLITVVQRLLRAYQLQSAREV